MFNLDDAAVVSIIHVVDGGEEGQQPASRVHLVPAAVHFLVDLVAAEHHVEIVLLAKLLQDVLAEEETDAAVGDGPAGQGAGVGPDQVTGDPVGRDDVRPLDGVDVLEAVDERRDAPVAAEDPVPLAVDESRHRHPVEGVQEGTPYLKQSGITVSSLGRWSPSLRDPDRTGCSARDTPRRSRS